MAKRPIFFIALILLIMALFPLKALAAETAKKPLAEFVTGEVIVKFRPSVNISVSQLDKDNPESAKFSNRASINSLLAKHKLNNASKTIKNLNSLDRVMRKYAKRTKRAPRNAVIPDLSRIHTLKFQQDTDINSVIDELKKDPNVEYAEPNYIMHACVVPNDTYYDSSGAWGQSYKDMWGLHIISAESAWDTTTGTSDIVVAVVDTGLDYDHEDIVGNVYINAAEAINGVDDDGNGFIDDVRGWNFVSGNNNPYDDNFHGTHCSGTIAGVGNNSKGIVGVTWSCKIMPVKGLNSGGSGATSWLSNCVIYAADNGADVISNSWGGSGTSSLITDTMNYAYALGCVIVVAAGNSNDDAAYYNPANVPCVITVAASDQYDHKCSFSNWGTMIDVAAPGGGVYVTSSYDRRNILSLKSASFESTSSYDPALIVGTNYLRISGTSMACPHVSGLAALILSNKPTLTNYQVTNIITTSADDIGSPGFDIYFGYGRINAYKALQVIDFFPPTISLASDVIVGDYTVYWHGASHESGIDCYELREGTNEAAFSEDFESGMGGWALSGFISTDEVSHSTSTCAYSCTGDNVNNTISSVTSYEITSSDNTLSYWCYYDIEDYYDHAYVEVSTDETTWSTVDSLTGTNLSWTYKVCPLAEYTGKSIYIRFRYQTDSSYAYRGFYVDDINVNNVRFNIVSSSISGNSYGFTGKPAGHYSYNVRAKNNTPGTWSIWSQTASIYVHPFDDIPPTTPAMYSVPPDTDGNFRVSWSAATDEGGISCYELQGYKERFFDDGESGTSAWHLYGFTLFTSTSVSPTHSYFSGSDDDYNSSMETVSSVEISSASDALSFWIWHITEDDKDYVYAEVSTNEVYWASLEAFTGDNMGWRKKTYPLTAYVGRSIFFRIRYQTDSSVNYAGCVVDDISIGPTYSTVDASVPTTHYDVTGKPYGHYWYKVRAKDTSNNWSSFSAPVKVTVANDTFPPTIPVLNPIGTINARDFTITWEASTDESGVAAYELHESPGKVPIFYDGAESGLAKWSTGGFIVSAGRYSEGSHSFHSGTGDDLNNYLKTVSSMEIGSTSDILSFDRWNDIESGWDYAYVDVSEDGTHWVTLESFTGSSGGWTSESYSLASYKGHSIFIRFRYLTDSSISYSGFYADNIYVGPDYSWTRLSNSLTGTSYSFTNKPYGTYTYRVRAKDGLNHWSDWSNMETAVVTVDGYSFHDAGSGVTVFVPITSITTTDPAPIVTIETVSIPPGPPPSGKELFGKIINFTCNHGTFTGPLYITMPRSPGVMNPGPYVWDSGTLSWINTGLVIASLSNTYLQFATPHLSMYGIFGTTGDLDNINVYPNPYTIGKAPGGVNFSNLSGNETIRIYTLAGELVSVVEKPPAGTWLWNVRNMSGYRCARGIYIYMITNQEDDKRIGKIAILN